MAVAFYVLAAAVDPFALGQPLWSLAPSASARSQALGCAAVQIGDSTGTVTAFPSVLVVSPAAASVAISDSSVQAISAQVTTALTAALAAEATVAATEAAAQTAISALPPQMAAYQAQIKADMASVANWATLPAATQAEIMGRILQGFATMIGVLYSQALVTHSIQPPAPSLRAATSPSLRAT